MGVLQAPAESGNAPLRYKAAVGGVPVTREDGQLWFDTPAEAIFATMAKAGLGGDRSHDELLDALLQ
jgi:hypothetical protein